VTQFPPVETSEEATDALPSADVESLLTMLSKSLRAFQMYQANNPVFQRFRDALREEFLQVWSKADVLELTVHEDGFGYGGEVFGVGGGRDAMAFALYKDGIRYLKFFPGFEDEVPLFLEAVRRARQREDDANDMISVLWEEDFASFQYGYVDLLSEGVALPEPVRAETVPLSGSLLELDLELDEGAEGQDEVEGTSAFAAGLTREDFDETLYSLEPAELDTVRKEVEVEMKRDVRGDVLHALFDRLEDGSHPDRQAEIVEILDQLLPLLLSRGELGPAARILEELGRLVDGGVGVNAALSERVKELFARLSDPKVLEQFVAALEEGALAPDSEDVTLFFSRLEAGALPVLVRLAAMSTPAVSARLGAALTGLASRHPEAVAPLLASDDPVLVRGAARAAGGARLTRAVRGLHDALSRSDREVRVAAVEALISIGSTSALQALITALGDDDREVRIAAARALGAVRFLAAREPLAAALDDRRLRDADLTEKMAFYEAFGAVGGAAAVERLSRLLNHRRFLGRRPPVDLRACAALGLSKVGTPAARAALEKGRGDEDPVVRSAVLRALGAEATP
jgi:hypothetical protein